jgi:predicted NBD/HSP70 family sugar kinase
MLMRAGRPIDGGRDAVVRLIEDARDGEVDALAALAEVASWLGIGLAVLVNIFNPRLVVLGGVFERMYAISGPSIEDAMRRRALSPSAELVRVVPGRLGENAPLLGAAELAFEPLLADPAAWLGPRAAALATA